MRFPGRSTTHALPPHTRVPDARPGGRAALAVVTLLALVAGLVTLAAPRADAMVPVAPALAGLARGVDASRWQHPAGTTVDWRAAAAAGTSFAFLKATEGTRPENDFYAADAREARAAGIVIGSYHKGRPSMDAAAQARAFATRIQQVGGQQLPPVLDIEIDEGRSPAQLVAWTRTFLEETRRLTGRTPIVYTYRWFWITKTANSTAFTAYPLWIAEYEQPEPTFPLVGGWTEWTFWQRAGNDGRHAGFPTAVDLNVFAGSRDDLRQWVGPVSPAGGGTANPAPGPAPTEVVPAARGGATTRSATLPTTITIPAIPGVRPPAGLTLPVTLTLPPQLLQAAGPVADLLDSLPGELLKSARFS